ncbi:nitrate reductase [Paenibacillus darwinianus]|uniref:Nitrate reductase n=1 Tax=Paenibacillus darwinianus TaxID=1380763 RepID=A0A9W5S350_9BACL|nr:NCS1 family transporter [Paenibacillus darwinianus]EXX87045.1 nitrate reductase [Paenibacillus darwinianus]EXX90581.1 nitrate reductase [Paenibacillus darwinianus]EXX90607.1 nitrate reductase [Paenibacillus darwinianus]
MEDNRFNSLVSKDIVPVKSGQRVISGWGFLNIWVGMAVIIATFLIGANGIESMSLWELGLAIFFANLIIALIGSLSGDIGIEHGLSFAAYMRAPFGTWGVHIPAVSRGIVASIWFGIQTYLGAVAINYLVSSMTGFDSWFLWYVLFAIVQIVNTAMGIKAIDRFAVIAAPAIIIISVWIFMKVNGMALDKGINVATYAGDQNTTTFFLIMVANMGFWSALAIDIPNLTRFIKAPQNERSWMKRNVNNVWPHIIALPAVQTLMGIIGAVSLLGAGDANPINVIQGTASGWVYVVLLLMVVLAQWSTNTAANLIPATLTFINAGARIRLNFVAGLIIAGVIGTIVQPWAILNNLFLYLGYYGAILSAVAGIILCDYYVLRRRRLNVKDLYRQEGQFKYDGGVNAAGMIAWIIGGGLALMFMKYMYLVGFPAGFIAYYLLMKGWYLKRHKQAEIESGFSDDYLGTTVGRDWDIPLDEPAAQPPATVPVNS